MSLVSASASHVTNRILNCILAFIRSRQTKWGNNITFWVMWNYCWWHWCHVMSVLGSHNTDGIIHDFLHFLAHGDCTEMQHDFFGNVTPLVQSSTSHDASITITWCQALSRAPLYSTGEDDQWRCNMTFLVMWCLTLISTSIMWCWWCHQWHHCIPWVKMIEMRCSMSFLVMWCYWHQHHTTTMALSRAQHWCQP